MERLKHYFPNYILTVFLVIFIIAFSLTAFASNCVFNPSFFIDSAEKNNIYQRSYDYTLDYFEKNYDVSSIPAEIYMDGIDDAFVKNAVDEKINSFFDYINGKTDKLEESKMDFSSLEKNISDYFEKFAKEHNVDVNEEFNKQLDKTIKAAEKDINTFTNAYMFNYMQKMGILQKVRKIHSLIPVGMIISAIGSSVCIALMVLFNKKEIKSFLYWLAVSGLCSSVICIAACLIMKYSQYFNRLIVRTDYIYYAVTGLLNDFVDTFIIYQAVILAVSILIMAIYTVILIISGKKNKNI